MTFCGSIIFDCWAFVTRHPGLILVLIGVIGEGVEIIPKIWFEKFYEKFKRKLEITGAVCWGVLVIGLAIELSEAAELDRDVASSNERSKQLESTNLVLRATVAELESKVFGLKSAIPPRIISPLQRETFIDFLISSNNVSPKIPIKVFVAEPDSETEDFAKALRKLLNEAGYGTNDEIISIPKPILRPTGTATNPRLPDVFVVLASTTKEVPEPSLKGFGSLMVFTPSSFSISKGDKSHPVAYRYTESPNDIVYGLASLLTHVGVTCSSVSSHSLLKIEEVGFYIPNKVEK